MVHIKSILKCHYDIEVKKVISQKSGWTALAYKVCNDQEAYFFKIYEKKRASTLKWASLIDHYVPIVVWLNQNSELTGKIPIPLPTKGGAYTCEDDQGIYLLYEFIEGTTIGDHDLTTQQVTQLAEIIAELHLYGEKRYIPMDVMQEPFEIPFLPNLKQVLSHHLPDDIKKVLTPYVEQIKDLITQLEERSISLKKGDPQMVLCHTDLHNWNLMQAKQQLILIDWEGLKLAPVEADMMFLVDQPYFDQFLSTYRQVHPHFSLNLETLQFYQTQRKLEDIWEYLEQLLWDPQTEQEREDTLSGLWKALA